MRNRPIWQIVLAIFLFLLLQQQFQSPTLFSIDPILWKAFFLEQLALLPYWLILVTLLCVVVFFLGKNEERAHAVVTGLLVDNAASEPPNKSNRLWVLGGFVFLLCTLIQLEHQRSFFFTQDDNLMQFLPVILQGCRSLLGGTFPTWNPYQFLGAPTTSMGVYALTYPFTYLSYFLSRFILRNELFTLEIYCIFHMCAGYLSFYWAARCYRIRAAIAALAALCTVLSGWFLIATPSWFYVCPIFVYVPLMVVAVVKLKDGISGWRWILGLGLVIGLFFHAGNVQFWVYGMMFLWMSLLILKWSGLIGWRQIWSALAAMLFGIALVCPLLVPQFLETRNTSRIMSPETGQIFREWIAALVPGPWVGATAPATAIEPAWKTGALILYSGTTFILFFLLLLLCYILYRFERKVIGQNLWGICGVVAWLAAMGKFGIVWPIMMQFPLLSKFRVPIKFLAFFDLFAVLAGALVLERILSRISWHKFATAGVVTVTAILLTASAAMSLPTWYTYPFKPYPVADFLLEKIPNAKNQSQRMIWIGLSRSSSLTYWQQLPHNLPTVYRIPAVLGYDPLVNYSSSFQQVTMRLQSQPVQSLQEYGAEYALVPNDLEKVASGDAGRYTPMERTQILPKSSIEEVLAQGQMVFHNDELSITRVANVKPLAFMKNAPMTPLPITTGANGLNIDVSSVPNGGKVVANFFWYPEMHARIDGRPAEAAADSWQRITLTIPPGAQKVQLKFVPEWGNGFLYAMLAAAAALVCGFVGLRASSSAAAARKASP